MSLATDEIHESRGEAGHQAEASRVKPAGRKALKARRLLSVGYSPLARKIVLFNLLGMVVLVAGVLFLNPFRDSLVRLHQSDLGYRAQTVADIFEALAGAEAARAGGRAVLSADIVDQGLAHLGLETGTDAYLYDASGRLLAATPGRTALAEEGATLPERATPINDGLQALWRGLLALFGGDASPVLPEANSGELASLAAEAIAKAAVLTQSRTEAGVTSFVVAAPIRLGGEVLGAVSLYAVPGDIDHLVRFEREQVLQMFLIAILVSVVLSLILASTIANPLSDLAAAAQIGNDRRRSVSPGRVRIPDLSGRPDEIGRLSAALRGMVAALYDRIDANEQFAADVAHEIKNPLASLRSAVGSLRLVKKDEQRAKLLDVIEHDVRRLDRLVSDISNASRLDSELVKEDEQPFNLMKTLGNLTEYMSAESRRKGVDFITDLPPEPITITGLEARLAQVFVNLISNAISFCEEGDAIRVWARRRENRVLVVVEDTGPGIPEQALSKIFKRFYSDRPASHFGNNSGLGLAISKQIVEAHGGVIWAENIRPADADPTSEPLGARFVVGLPV